MPRPQSQAEKVLNYMRRRGAITQATATGVFGISRLAAIVHKLKSRGFDIQSRRVKGVNGMYAEYRLNQS
jgi:predicted ThiF/HesA family dinucleotide-utilizing enzyme